MIGQHPYTVVLTHDVDHLCLRKAPFREGGAGSFLKGCLWINLFRFLRRDLSLWEYAKGAGIALVYPLVKLGFFFDPWEVALQDILAMEEKYNARSTFFFIPFSQEAGFKSRGILAPRSRAALYNINNYKKLINELALGGWEVGVHGLNAHLSHEEAEREYKVMADLLPPAMPIGIRMHWLYQTEELWKNAAKGGFYYDATYGSNDKVGFPENKIHPFKRDNIWVIPLNIQDGTLLKKKYMGLTREKAWTRVSELMDDARRQRAVITILWHTNVFGPPLYWGNVYEKILKKAILDGARIMRCVDICKTMEELSP